MSGPRVAVARERWPIAGEFRIARGAKREAEVVTVTLTRGDAVGRGECVPYSRYGESVTGVMAAIDGAAAAIERGETVALAGAAASALDAARLDLAAQLTGVPAWSALGVPAPTPVPIAWTLSIDTPDAMGERAQRAPTDRLKVKLAGDGQDLVRLAAIREARPGARLWVDANEGLSLEGLPEMLTAMAALGVDLVEQPVPAESDAVLATFAHPVPVCADESFVDRRVLPSLVGRYDAVSVKLDKAGGPTEALRCIREARARGLRVVLGCMVSTSLSIAPALCLASLCDDVDLDGALLLARDRDGGMVLDGGRLMPGALAGWGHRLTSG